MQAMDRAAIETVGIPRLLLMEHAGMAVARQAQLLAPDRSLPVVICCGRGFNGGDGLAAARHLYAGGYAVHLALAERVDQLREEPAVYAHIAMRLDVPLREVTGEGDIAPVEAWMSSCGLIIDALLGIGARGPVREPMASLIDRMNRSGKPILSVDIPSGLDADHGHVQGIAVKATVTVTFGLPKQGCFVAEGPAHAGTLVVDPITIPRAILETDA